MDKRNSCIFSHRAHPSRPLLLRRLLVSESILTTSAGRTVWRSTFRALGRGSSSIKRGWVPVIKLEVHSSLALKTYEEVSTRTGMGFVDPGRTLLTQEK
ncbi:hypothetical protein ACSQ67_018953 [Phaseolus vulgaris]